MAMVGGIGHFVPWNGACLFIGSNVGVVPEHSHYAIQVVFGAEPGVRLRTSAAEAWASYRGAIVPSRQPHTMDATGLTANAVMFVEPETREGRALAERHPGEGIAPLDDALLAEVGPPVFEAWRAARTPSAIAEAAQRVLRALTGGVEPSVVSDPRILRATAYIRDNIERSLTLEEVAGEAFLSPSRFRHLFVEQTGMGLRPYILWRRFLRAWELIMAGSALSSAAHQAGFADAAHLTRTCRQMFGFPPSAMQPGAPLLPDDAPRAVR